MGICMSNDQREAAARNADIDRQLAQSQQERDKTVKLLLLGMIRFFKSAFVLITIRRW
jgi:hypothetical protein